MTGWRLGKFLAVFCVLLVASGLVGCYQQSPAPPPATPPASEQPSTPQTGAPAQVNISGLAFSPATITVSVGTMVTWTNRESLPHTVTGQDINSSTLSQGDTFKYTFTKKGTFNYHCSLHPAMTGTVIVGD